MKRIEVTRAFSSYQVGDILELQNMEADFAISRGFAVLVEIDPKRKRGRPRKNPVEQRPVGFRAQSE